MRVPLLNFATTIHFEKLHPWEQAYGYLDSHSYSQQTTTTDLCTQSTVNGSHTLTNDLAVHTV